jgi:hypothetical protein
MSVEVPVVQSSVKIVATGTVLIMLALVSTLAMFDRIAFAPPIAQSSISRVDATGSYKEDLNSTLGSKDIARDGLPAIAWLMTYPNSVSHKVPPRMQAKSGSPLSHRLCAITCL